MWVSQGKAQWIYIHLISGTELPINITDRYEVINLTKIILLILSEKSLQLLKDKITSASTAWLWELVFHKANIKTCEYLDIYLV